MKSKKNQIFNYYLKALVALSNLTKKVFLAGIFATSLFIIGCDETSAKKPQTNNSTVNTGGETGGSGQVSKSDAKILFLHHSVGQNLQGAWVNNPLGDFKQRIAKYNKVNSKSYAYTERFYPDDQVDGNRAYHDPNADFWHNHPFVYWDMWVNPNTKAGVPDSDKFASIVASADLVIFKHCYTESHIKADTGKNNPNQEHVRSLEVYKAQYAALKTKMKSQADTKFLVFTLPPQLQNNYHNTTVAQRAKDFSDWVKNTWDEKGDNIYVFDFRSLVADANGLFLPLVNASSSTNNHPNQAINVSVLSNFVQRTIDVLEGRGDSGNLKGCVNLGCK